MLGRGFGTCYQGPVTEKGLSAVKKKYYRSIGHFYKTHEILCEGWDHVCMF